MQQEPPNNTTDTGVDFSKYPNAQKLLQCCIDFLAEVENLYVNLHCHFHQTLSQTEDELHSIPFHTIPFSPNNQNHPTLPSSTVPPSNNPSTPGHVLESHLNTTYGPNSPTYKTLCSLTLLGLREGWVANIPIEGQPHYRRSKISLPRQETRFFSITAVYVDSVEEFSGQHHSHPYGEINCVVQVDEGAELKGMQGWQGKGWTSPGPGTHQYVLSFFFLFVLFCSALFEE